MATEYQKEYAARIQRNLDLNFSDAWANGHEVLIAGVPVPYGTTVEVRAPLDEVDALRERIAQLEAMLNGAKKPAPVEVRYDLPPAEDLPLVPSKSLLRSDELIARNDDYALKFKYDLDFSMYRVYADDQYIGAADEDEAAKLDESFANHPASAKFGKGYFKQQQENAKRPKSKRQRRPAPVIHVPNLYVERDPHAGGGPAYSLG